MPQADFVKVDVEGFECHVWRGSRELLKQRPRLIQSEVGATDKSVVCWHSLSSLADLPFLLAKVPCTGPAILAV